MPRSVEPTVTIGAHGTSSREEAVQTNDWGFIDQEMEAGSDRGCMTINSSRSLVFELTTGSSHYTRRRTFIKPALWLSHQISRRRLESVCHLAKLHSIHRTPKV